MIHWGQVLDPAGPSRLDARHQSWSSRPGPPSRPGERDEQRHGHRRRQSHRKRVAARGRHRRGQNCQSHEAARVHKVSVATRGAPDGPLFLHPSPWPSGRPTACRRRAITPAPESDDGTARKRSYRHISTRSDRTNRWSRRTHVRFPPARRPTRRYGAQASDRACYITQRR